MCFYYLMLFGVLRNRNAVIIFYMYKRTPFLKHGWTQTFSFAIVWGGMGTLIYTCMCQHLVINCLEGVGILICMDLNI